MEQVAANRKRADEIAKSKVEHGSIEYWRQVSECGCLRSWADGVEAAQAEQALTDEDGVDYFVRSIGERSWSYVSALHKYEAVHPETIRRVIEEAKTRFPEAADVIASMVFFKSLDISREAFLRSHKSA